MTTHRLEEWKKALRDKARELEEKFDLRQKLEQAGDIAGEVARKAGDVITTTLERARQEYERLDAEYRIGDTVQSAADKVEETLKTGREVAQEKAEKLKQEIERHYRRWESFSDWARDAGKTADSVEAAVGRIRQWASKNPDKVVAVTVSVMAGVRAGSAFPHLGATLLGVTTGSHWLFHSAVAPSAFRLLTEKYVAYLGRQQQRMAEGRLSEAEKARCEFQRDVVKYVGAPLLGVFSITLGGTLIAESINPSRIAGMPVELILGGNPILNSLWLFANGLICIHAGYRFFLLAVADAEDVQKVVQQIKGVFAAPASS